MGCGQVASEVWIAELAGNRALRYASDGTFQQQIGRAGFPASYEGIEPGMDRGRERGWQR